MKLKEFIILMMGKYNNEIERIHNINDGEILLKMQLN